MLLISSMFNGATDFTSDLSTWDVSNVTDMSRMFTMFGILQVTFQVGMYLMLLI